MNWEPYCLQNISLVKINGSSIMNSEPVVCVYPLLELVMMVTRKVRVTVWIVYNLNRHNAMGQCIV